MTYRKATRTEVKGRRILVYDGNCGVCYATSRLIQRYARSDLELLAFAELPGIGLLSDLTPEEVQASAHYITPEGIEYHGGESMTRVARLLPAGWDPSHPDAAHTAPAGIGADPSFAAGGDRVRYRFAAPQGKGPYRIEAQLVYQPIGARHAAELFRRRVGAVRTFELLYRGADPRPEPVAAAQARVH